MTDNVQAQEERIIRDAIDVISQAPIIEKTCNAFKWGDGHADTITSSIVKLVDPKEERLKIDISFSGRYRLQSNASGSWTTRVISELNADVRGGTLKLKSYHEHNGFKISNNVDRAGLPNMSSLQTLISSGATNENDFSADWHIEFQHPQLPGCAKGGIYSTNMQLKTILLETILGKITQASPHAIKKMSAAYRRKQGAYAREAQVKTVALAGFHI